MHHTYTSLFVGGRGNWSTDGCNTTVNATNGHIACHCDHLTNFACLVVRNDIHTTYRVLYLIFIGCVC